MVWSKIFPTVSVGYKKLYLEPGGVNHWPMSEEQSRAGERRCRSEVQMCRGCMKKVVQRWSWPRTEVLLVQRVCRCRG